MFDGVCPATDSVNFSHRISADGGTTWENLYRRSRDYTASGATGGGDYASSVTEIPLNGSQGNVTTAELSGCHGHIIWHNLNSTSKVKGCNWIINYPNSSDNLYQMSGAAIQMDETSAIDALQFYYSSGNVATGTFTLYGIKS